MCIPSLARVWPVQSLGPTLITQSTRNTHYKPPTNHHHGRRKTARRRHQGVNREISVANPDGVHQRSPVATGGPRHRSPTGVREDGLPRGGRAGRGGAHRRSQSAPDRSRGSTNSAVVGGSGHSRGVDGQHQRGIDQAQVQPQNHRRAEQLRSAHHLQHRVPALGSRRVRLVQVLYVGNAGSETAAVQKGQEKSEDPAAAAADCDQEKDQSEAGGRPRQSEAISRGPIQEQGEDI